MRIDILTLFPEMIEGVFNSSILKRAIEAGYLEINIHDFRLFSKDKNHKVDDYTYGGGAGMLIRVDPVCDCLKSIPGYKEAHKLITTPTGKVFNQDMAKLFSSKEHIIIICGHYEGIDDRILNYIDEEVSIGDYVLTGGELAACIIVDATSRLIEGVLGNNESSQTETFDDNLLEYPQYTRPVEYDGYKVPDVLISGHHENIRKFRRYESLKKTYLKRPELIEKASLTKEDLKMLEEIKSKNLLDCKWFETKII